MDKLYCVIAIRKGMLCEDNKNLNYSVVGTNNKIIVQFREYGKKIGYDEAYGKVSSCYVVASPDKITIKFDTISEELKRKIKSIKTLDIKYFNEEIGRHVDKTSNDIFFIINYKGNKIICGKKNSFFLSGNKIVKFIKELLFESKKEYYI